MGKPDRDIKLYQDNVWVLKRVGLTMLALFVALPIAPLLDALGASRDVVLAYLIGAISLWFAATNWWFFQDRRQEQRRRAAIRARRSGEPIEPVPVAPRSPRARMSRHALAVGVLVVSLAVPLIVIGALADSVALRDLGLGLMVLEFLVLATVLPGLSARRHHRSGQPSSSSNTPS